MKIIDPWGSELPEDYTRIVKDFGLERFNSKIFPKPNKLMRRGVVFAGRDLKIISRAIKEKKPYYVLSGLMPSAEKLHLGNKLVVDNIKYFQQNNAKTFVLVADLEAASVRDIDLKEARKRALNYHIPAYIALGLDIKKTTFYFQSENKEVMKLAYEFSKRITLNEFKAAYGKPSPGKIMAVMTQAGDILFPQLKETMPGIIPVGVDQDPHIRITRDIVKRTKRRFFAPSSLYHKYTPALNGSLKMSKSTPNSYIELPEDPKTACNKLKRALTGGRESIAKQKKLGGQPEKCMIFELYKQHLIEDDKELNKRYNDCKKGKILCGECKEHACKLITAFMNKLTKDMEKARKNINKARFI